jgi:hypothetical protein
MGVDSWLFVFSVIDEGALLFLVVYFVSFYDIICSSMLTLLSDSDPYPPMVDSSFGFKYFLLLKYIDILMATQNSKHGTSLKNGCTL